MKVEFEGGLTVNENNLVVENSGDYTIDWKVALIMAVLFVVGAYLGSKFAVNVNEKLLKRIFGSVLILVALKMIFGK